MKKYTLHIVTYSPNCCSVEKFCKIEKTFAEYFYVQLDLSHLYDVDLTGGPQTLTLTAVKALKEVNKNTNNYEDVTSVFFPTPPVLNIVKHDQFAHDTQFLLFIPATDSSLASGDYLIEVEITKTTFSPLVPQQYKAGFIIKVLPKLDII